jgi:hypothetical protein
MKSGPLICIDPTSTCLKIRSSRVCKFLTYNIGSLKLWTKVRWMDNTKWLKNLKFKSQSVESDFDSIRLKLGPYGPNQTLLAESGSFWTLYIFSKYLSMHWLKLGPYGPACLLPAKSGSFWTLCLFLHNFTI